MNAPYLGDHRPAPILRNMTPEVRGFGGKLALFWFSLGVIFASVGFYLAGMV